MKNLVATAAVAAALFAAGPALADVTAETFAANTVVATAPDGTKLKFNFNPGGAYTMTAGAQAVTGTWAVENGQFCLTPAGGEKSCSPHVADRKVGDAWTVTGADGVTYAVKVEPGR
ncbi:MAG: hypothetical protein NW200_04920 [Hyphomonadaceae bacterium]|nr:hypothetical protein [Hyphomonadaceae bacterium]